MRLNVFLTVSTIKLEHAHKSVSVKDNKEQAHDEGAFQTHRFGAAPTKCGAFARLVGVFRLVKFNTSFLSSVFPCSSLFKTSCRDKY